MFSLKAQPLQQRTIRVVEDLERLAAEAAHVISAAETCMDDLKQRQEHLRVFLAGSRGAAERTVEALSKKRSALMTEVKAIEAHSAYEEADIGFGRNGPAWASALAERRAALTSRIENAAVQQAAAAELSKNSTARCRAQIEKLREARNMLTCVGISPSAPSSPNPMLYAGTRTWKAQFEALINKQRTLADGLAAGVVDDQLCVLDQAITAISTSMHEATESSEMPPALLFSTLRAVKGLADAERRRAAILRSRWDELKGLRGKPTNGFQGLFAA